MDALIRAMREDLQAVLDNVRAHNYGAAKEGLTRIIGATYDLQRAAREPVPVDKTPPDPLPG